DSLSQQLQPATSLRFVSEAAGALGSLGIMLLLSIFFLLGGPTLAEQVSRAFGDRARPDVQFVLDTVHDTFDSFARTQLLECTAFGVGTWICLGLAHVSGAPIVGVLAGILLLVPVVGALLAIAIPALVTLVLNPSAFLLVVVALVLLEQFVLNVLGPRLMSQR